MKARVLVIQESNEESKSLRSLLTEAGFEASSAPPSQRTLRDALREPPEVILFSYDQRDPLNEYLLKLLTNQNGAAAPPIILLARKTSAVPAVHRASGRVADVLEKPITVKAVTDSIEAALLKLKGARGEHREEPVPERTPAPAAEAMPPPADPSASQQVLALLSRRLAERVQPAPPASGDPPPGEPPAPRADAVLDPSFLADLAAGISSIFERCGKDRFQVSGRLISLSDLLQALGNTRQTGVLTVTAEENIVEIHLRTGEVCFLNPRKVNMQLCKEELHCSFFSFSVGDLKRTLEESVSQDDSMFFRLLEHGRIQKEKLRDLMVSLGIEVLRECALQGESCSFDYRSRESGKRFLEFDAALPIQRLLLSLFTDLDEWRRMHKDITVAVERFAPVREAVQAPGSSISEKQSAILASLDVPRGIMEISSHCHLSPFEVWRGLGRLRQAGLVEKV